MNYGKLAKRDDRPWKFKKPFIRIGTIMFVVAVAALATWSTIMWKRSKEYSAMAKRHALLEEWERDNLRSATHSIERPYRFDGLRQGEMSDSEIQRARKKLSQAIAKDLAPVILAKRIIMEHELRLKKKYEKAARYPWMGVEADSPPPLPSNQTIFGTDQKAGAEITVRPPIAPQVNP